MKMMHDLQSHRYTLLLVSLMLSGGLLAASLFLATGQAHAQSGSISGTVAYYGESPGTPTVWTSIYTDTSGSPLGSYGSTGPVYTYTFSSLEDGDYYLFAYLDIDGSGGAPGALEPFAWYDSDRDGTPDPVTIAGDATVAGIDIALIDPWQLLTGLRGQVNALIVHPAISGTLYAAVGVPSSGSNTKIYTSADGGTSWTPVYTSTFAQIEGLATSGSLVYAAGSGGFGADVIVKSIDSGGNWTIAFTGAPGSYTALDAVAINPITTTTAYAAGAVYGLDIGVVYRTQDDGATWTPVLTAPHQGSDRLAAFHTLAVSPFTPTTVYAGGYESTASLSYAVLYRSTDGGENWTRVLTDSKPPAQQFTAIAIHPFTPTWVYAGTQVPKYVYRSYDGGDTWDREIHHNRGFMLGIDPPHTIYAPDDWREIDVSTQDGDPGTWYKAGGIDNDTPDDMMSFAIDIALTPSALYFGGEVAGVHRSDNGAVDWYRRSDGIEPAVVPVNVDPDPQDRSRVFAATGCGGGWLSEDSGHEWAKRFTAPNCIGAFAINPQDSTIVYAGAYESSRGAILRSTDSGATFRSVYTTSVIGTGGQERIYDLAVAPSLSNTVYAVGEDIPLAGATHGVVVRSLDGGSSWTQVLALPNATADVVAIDPTDPTTIYVGGEDCSAGPCVGLVSRSATNGLQWERVYTPTAKVRSIVVDYQKPDVLYTADDGRQVHKSTDGGETWSTLVGSGSMLSIDPHVPSHLYLVDTGYVFESIDGGRNWSDYGAPINQGAHVLWPSALAIDSGTVTQTLYAGSQGLYGYTRPAPQVGQPTTVTLPGLVKTPVGTTVTVSALVVDQHENWVEDGTVVTFTVDPPGAFTGDTLVQTTGDGRADIPLYSATTGTAQITATTGTATDTIVVHFRTYRFISETYVDDLIQPTVVRWAPDGRAYIALKYGVVRVVEDGQLLPAPFIDISDQVNNYWDRGLLGLALHPSFPLTPYVYLLYVYDPPELAGSPGAANGADGGGERVSRLIRVTADPATNYRTAVPGSAVVILGQNSTYANIGDPADPNGVSGARSCDAGGTPITDCLPVDSPTHSVGTLAFGADGSLYVSHGDGAGFFLVDQRALRALDVDSLAGKVLRIDPDTGQGLPDNPFYDGDPASDRSRVWSLGMRNPFRLTLHPDTDEPYIGDVGWELWEEINTGKGESFGWPCYEGDDTGSAHQPNYAVYTSTQAACAVFYAQEGTANEVKAPLYAYAHAGMGAAVLAGDFYRGSSYPASYQDALFIADYNGDWIHYLTLDESGAAAHHHFMHDVSEEGGPVFLGLGPGDNLYYAVLNPSGPGEIRRIRYTDDPTARASATPTNGYPDLTVSFSGAGSFDPNEDVASLTYEWSFGDGTTAGGTSPTHTYTLTDTYTVVLTVSNSLGGQSTDDLIITVGNLAPTATIISPTSDLLYNAGDIIQFSGGGVDFEDDVLSGDSLGWEVLLHHQQHIHPNVFNATGPTGEFVDSDHGDNNWTELCLTATDSEGLQGTDCVELHPRTVTYTLDTVPSGLQLYYSGIAYTTPFTVETIVNGQRLIFAPPEQGEHKFLRWSDGGEAGHMITVAAADQTVVATYYSVRVWLPLVMRSYTRQ